MRAIWGTKFCGRVTTGPIVWLIFVIGRAAQPPAITYAAAVPSSTGVIAVSGADSYLAGVAQSAFPATPGAFQTVLRAPQLTTAFVVKYNLEIEPVGPPPLFVAAGVVSSAEAEPE